jgi:hypothetical protein
MQMPESRLSTLPSTQSFWNRRASRVAHFRTTAAVSATRPPYAICCEATSFAQRLLCCCELPCMDRQHSA